MIIEHIISFLAPHNCISCRIEGSLLCQDCLIRLPYLRTICYRCAGSSGDTRICPTCQAETSLSSVTVRTAYTGIAKDLLWKLKFDRAAAAAMPIATACTASLSIEFPYTISYVPTATNRVRQRGYDQAQLIAGHVAKRLKRPIYPLLARTNTVRQVGSGAVERRTQLANAFRARNSTLLQNAHILLIDDVITTGSSLEAAARVLLHAGAKRVDALAFAQAVTGDNNGLVSATKAGIITSVR